MKHNNTAIDLGTLLQEAERLCDDDRVSEFIGDLLEYEKSSPGWYKEVIRDLLKKHCAKGESNAAS